MKVLLTAINAKYIHTNLAIYCLKAYAKEYRDHIKFAEFTINNYTDDILQGIYKEKPDFIGFSCYIWNIEMIDQLCVELRKVLPYTKIWLGGPEVSFDVEKRLWENKDIDGIIIGEGEETFKELLDYYIGKKNKLTDIKGIAFKATAWLEKKGQIAINQNDKDRENTCYDNIGKDHSNISKEYRNINKEYENINKEYDDINKEYGNINNNHEIIVTPVRPEMDLSTLPFPYENMEDFENKIIYYETSRGCPYSCRYCLSSIDKRLRLRDMKKVQKELDVFLSHKVPQVKFVDRTFNCNRAHTKAIWKYIKEHDNGITNFHFEISADIMGEEEIALLNSMREGLVQLEIGVQSTNPKTIKAIDRHMDFGRLSQVVSDIHKGRNVHQHLDLIAGLPYEDYKSFRNSFNDVYALKPDQLQLGFLKVLKGSGMFYDSKEMGIVYKDQAPFEVLYTKWLSFDDVLKLKEVEDMVEVYYNSGQFIHTIMYLEHFFKTPFDLYQALGEFYEKNGLFQVNHNRMRRYEILLDFVRESFKNPIKEANETNETINSSFIENFDEKTFEDILVFDLYLRENLKSRPFFAENQEPYKNTFRDFYVSEEMIKKYVGGLAGEKIPQLKRYLHIEHFDIHVPESAKTGKMIAGSQFILFDYLHRNKLNGDARYTIVKEMDK